MQKKTHACAGIISDAALSILLAGSLCLLLEADFLRPSYAGLCPLSWHALDAAAFLSTLVQIFAIVCGPAMVIAAAVARELPVYRRVSRGNIVLICITLIVFGIKFPSIVNYITTPCIDGSFS